MNNATAILLITCKDHKGLVARVSGFIHDFGGNILDSDHHTDRETGDFLMRTVFDLSGFQIPQEEIANAFSPIAKIFGMSFQVHFSDRKPRVGILVSQYDHCLVDVLQRHRRGELAIEIPVIVSNCGNMARINSCASATEQFIFQLPATIMVRINITLRIYLIFEPQPLPPASNSLPETFPEFPVNIRFPRIFGADPGASWLNAPGTEHYASCDLS